MRAASQESNERGFLYRPMQELQFNDEAMLSMTKLHVPLTIRLQPKSAAFLNRAGLEQSLEGYKLATVQEIAEEAIQKWLRASGYLD